MTRRKSRSVGGVFHEVGIVRQTVTAPGGGVVQVECGEVRIRFPIDRLTDVMAQVGRDATVEWAP